MTAAEVTTLHELEERAANLQAELGAAIAAERTVGPLGARDHAAYIRALRRRLDAVRAELAELLGP